MDIMTSDIGAAEHLKYRRVSASNGSIRRLKSNNGTIEHRLLTKQPYIFVMENTLY
jgi:hypothetical protein